MLKRWIEKLIVILFVVGIVSCTDDGEKRQTIRLDGEWTVIKTDGTFPSGLYPSTIPVPGLVDLASPALDMPGTLYPDGWYWHKRTFSLENTSFEIAELKIFKAKYHTKLYMNGRFAGENHYCFTPS